MQFNKLGNFKMRAHLHLKAYTKASIDPPQKCAAHLKLKLQAKIDKMENNRLINKNTQLTNWCNSLKTSIKRDGSLRLRLDQNCLNDNLKQYPNKVPTMEDLNPDFLLAK